MRDSLNSAADSTAIAAAAAALQRGALIVYPTETLYGLGADTSNPAALDALVALKVRADHKPISVLIVGNAMLNTVAARITPLARRLIARFWPGPLTLVMTARPSLSNILTAGSGTIGVRWSSHPIANALVEKLGSPLTTPSANPTGQTPPTTIAQARAYFGDRVASYVDGGRLPGGMASTVVDVTGDQPRVLREGAIAIAALQAALAEAA
ncbi:MAG: threonylcarbamoyl-AMP synthase [Deltaproteobacteria bacterium]|nr:threonylcarbamoyl-AMP synthase [Deltaproteobacteria bacterium]MBI3386429.1 threonylcarbamoyl-AMP synthase [Deltaproteobacteria bacterium]